MLLSLVRTSTLILSEKIECFRFKIKSWTNHFTKVYFIKNKKTYKNIEDRKQLEGFLGCLNYASNFTKDLAKLIKPLWHKFKKKVSTCST